MDNQGGEIWKMLRVLDFEEVHQEGGSKLGSLKEVNGPLLETLRGQLRKRTKITELNPRPFSVSICCLSQKVSSTDFQSLSFSLYILVSQMQSVIVFSQLILVCQFDTHFHPISVI